MYCAEFYQGSKGIRQWQNRLFSPMTIHKITPSVDYKKWSKSLDTSFNELPNQNLLRVPKVVKPKNKNPL